MAPARGVGVPASPRVEVQSGARIMHCVAGKAEPTVLVTSTAGYGFLCNIGDMEPISSRKMVPLSAS